MIKKTWMKIIFFLFLILSLSSCWNDKEIENTEIIDKEKVEVEVEKKLLENPLVICNSWCEYSSESEEIWVSKTFQNAIDNFDITKNDWILIKDWTYILENWITFKWDNLKVIWESKDNTIIIWQNKQDIIWWTWNNWTLKNVTLDWKTNQSYTNFSISWIDWMTLDNVKIITSDKGTWFCQIIIVLSLLSQITFKLSRKLFNFLKYKFNL